MNRYEIMANSNNAGSNQVPEWIKAFNKFVEFFIKDKKSVFLEPEVDFNQTWSKDIENCLKLLEDVGTMNSPQNKDDKKVDNSLYTKLKNLDKTSDDYKRQYALLWHCYYIMYIMGDTAKTFFPKLRPEGLVIKETIQDENKPVKLFVKEYASTNQIHSDNSILPFRCLLRLFKKLWKEPQNDLKKQIIELLLDDSNKDNSNVVFGTDYDVTIKNILIYLCDPDKYVRIISQGHKKKILKYLASLIEENKDSNSMEKQENRLKRIENVIEKALQSVTSGTPQQHNSNGFYNNIIRPFWNSSEFIYDTNKKGELTTETLLKYKKAIVLYGPPGTSKSYTARELGKSLICKTFDEELKNNSSLKGDLLKKFLDHELQIFGEKKDEATTRETTDNNNWHPMSHIHILQLHPNYTYDDFIVGKTIREGNVDVQKGYLLGLVEDIDKDREKGDEIQKRIAALPHIVILDEINRVDISRVFGELFTAMESGYRKDGIKLPASIITKYDDGGKEQKTDPLSLKVPEDLYFIGTMNMIDFSLEQVDFALRRRFAWIESTFDKARLKDIIKEKDQDPKFDIDEYVKLCEKVNNMIAKEPSLGECYRIGHTFFAEIVDIMKETGLSDISKGKELLWAISIKPMIEAYCGSMDNEAKNILVDDCKDLFIPKDSQNK